MRNVLTCTRGAVAVEFALCFAIIGTACLLGGQRIGPAAYDAVVRAEQSVIAADAALANLCAALRTIDDADVTMCPPAPPADDEEA